MEVVVVKTVLIMGLGLCIEHLCSRYHTHTYTDTHRERYTYIHTYNHKHIYTQTHIHKHHMLSHAYKKLKLRRPFPTARPLPL